MAVHAGSWFGLPDFGITEKIGQVLNKPAAPSGGSNLFGPQPSQASYNPPAPQILGAQYPQPAGPARPSSGSGIPSTSSSIPTNSNFNTGIQNIQQQQNNGNDQINADYESAMGALAGQEEGLRGQAGAASGQIETQGTAAKNEITNNQGVAEGGVNTSLQTAEKQGTSAMQQARDLFRQTQQSNIAQLSALGISSSSVAEALAERLGVETSRRIAGVTGSVQEVRQNAVNELGRIKTYYTGKITDVDNQVRDQKAQIQNSLVQGLNQINSARNQAASAKAQARASLLSEVQNSIYSLTQQQQQFEQSLQAWAAQKSAALTPIAQDPNYVNNLLAQTNRINQQFTPTGFVATPSFNVDKSGQYTGQINVQKKAKDDPLAALYQQAGIQ